jgi:ribose-phosphate pyrophosphokinase
MIRVRYGYSHSSSTMPVEMKHMPGGELHPTIDTDHLDASEYTIYADTKNSDDLFGIALVANAIRRNAQVPIKALSLVIGYVPYARQDRIVGGEGEALSIEVMADFINMLNFDAVIIADPHSDTTPALIRNAKVMSQEMIFSEFLIRETADFDTREIAYEPSEYILVSPDAGAIKKTEKLATKFGFKGVAYANKTRNTRTGKITGCTVDRLVLDGEPAMVSQLQGEKLLVVDDICDGGYTFTQLAEVLNTFEPASLELYVTHGIFSKGLEPLYVAGYTRVVTTNAYGMEGSTELYALEKEEKKALKFVKIDIA